MKDIFPDNTVKDYGDDYISITVFYRSDMTVSTTEQIADKYIDESNETVWVVSEIGKNAAAETLYLKVLSEGSTKPSWIPDAIVSS